MGSEPEDFRVDEVPLYDFSGEGEHFYLQIEKRHWTTPAMLRALASAANLKPQVLGYAGLKDKHAITTQWVSLPKTEAPPSSWTLPDGIRILGENRHQNKLRTGHLLGNSFCIALQEVTGSPEAAEEVARCLREGGMLNYYGAQRFGTQGSGLRQAIEWLNVVGAGGRAGSSFHRKFFPSVIQAEIFNRYVALRLPLGRDKLLVGEVVRLDGNRRVFVVEQPEAELERLLTGDVHLTGPILGPKAKPAEGVAKELEEQVLAELGLEPAQMETLGRFAPGSRRDVVVPLDSLSVEGRGPGGLTLKFFLPAGSYATQVVREFTRTPFLSDTRRD